MTKEQDRALAELIRSASRKTEAITAEVNKTIAETQHRATEAANVKVNLTQFDMTGVAKVQEQSAEVLKNLQANIQAVQNVKVNIDTEAIKESVKVTKQANAQAKYTVENINRAIEAMSNIRPNVMIE